MPDEFERLMTEFKQYQLIAFAKLHQLIDECDRVEADLIQRGLLPCKNKHLS